MVVHMQHKIEAAARERLLNEVATVALGDARRIYLCAGMVDVRNRPKSR